MTEQYETRNPVSLKKAEMGQEYGSVWQSLSGKPDGLFDKANAYKPISAIEMHEKLLNDYLSSRNRRIALTRAIYTLGLLALVWGIVIWALV